MGSTRHKAVYQISLKLRIRVIKTPKKIYLVSNGNVSLVRAVQATDRITRVFYKYNRGSSFY